MLKQWKFKQSNHKGTGAARIIRAAFILILVFSGGFYGYSAMLAGILFLAAILWGLLSAQRLYSLSAIAEDKHKRLDWQTLLPFLFAFLFPFLFLPVSIWAVDRPMALAGFLHWSPLLLWVWLCFQMEQEEKNKIWRLVPAAGTAMLLFSLTALLTEPTKELLWQADRLGGTFQYSNTCALFFLCGLIILTSPVYAASGSQNDLVQKLLAATLSGGILLTGSRSIFLLTLFWAIVKAVRRPEFKKPAILLAAIAAGGAGLYVAMTGSLQNMGRILTLFTNNSTILGRILYMKDALRMLAKFPFGLGWQGYYYIQPMYQHGVYTTRYVHNDYLQTALDLGIFPAVLMIAYLLWQLLKGRQSLLQKELLAVLMLAAFSDFHMQYLLIAMMGILCLDLGREKEAAHKFRQLGKAQRREDIFFAVLISLMFFYGLVPFMAERLHMDDVVLEFFPHYTEAELRLLEIAGTAEEAEALAADIVNHNSYAAAAYRHLGTIASMRGEPDEMTHNMDRAVEIRRYDTALYEFYDVLLEDMLGRSELTEAERAHLVRVRETLPQRLAALESETDPLAFRLRDVPAFAWQKEP